MAKVELNLMAGMGTITVDGEPVHGVTGIQIISKPGDVAKVTLDVFAGPLTVSTDADVKIVDRETVDHFREMALELHGFLCTVAEFEVCQNYYCVNRRKKLSEMEARLS